MASLTVSVPDNVVPRVALAFGKTDPSGNRIPATAAELQTMLQSYLKGGVVEYETAIAAKQKRSDVAGEDWTVSGVVVTAPVK